MQLLFAALLPLTLGPPVPLPDAPDWSPRFHPNGPNWEVISLCSAGGNLYAGGAFTSFGPFARPGLMRWDGKAWNPVGTGLAGEIRGVAADSLGHVYVTGALASVSGGGAYGFAVWDGSAWSFPPGTRNGEGYGDPVIIGGKAYWLSGTQKEVYRWDGSDASPLPGKADVLIYSLGRMGADLIAGGDFNSIGGTAANHVARFDGNAWGPLGDGLAGTVRAFADGGDGFLAAGETGTAGTGSWPNLVRWNGNLWEPFADPIGGKGYIEEMVRDGDRLYVAGYFPPADGPDSLLRPALLGWNGTAWEPLAEPYLDNQVRALAVHDGRLWAGGRFSHPAAPFLGRWDGRAWTGPQAPWPTQSPAGRVSCLSARGTRLIAAGAFPSASPDSFSLTTEWTGNGWEPRGPALPISESWNWEVTACAQDDRAVYLAGYDNRRTRYFLMGWSGGAWTIMDNGTAPYTCLSAAADGLYVGGYFQSIGGVAARRVARWDGSAWHAVGAGLDYPVTALASDGAALFAAEQSTTSASGIPSQVSRFAGGSWSILGATASAPAFNGTIRELIARDGVLWAAGEFAGNGLLNARASRPGMEPNGAAWRTAPAR